MALVECVPNVSEGRRADVIDALADAVSAVDGVRFLDRSSDPTHNRSVFTYAGEPEPLQQATIALFGLAVAAIDLSGRPHAVIDTKVTVRIVGDLQTELVHDFFEGFASAARANVHLKVMYGRSNHHKIEACFKAFARALRVACSKDKRLARTLPSTKGLL